MPHAILPIIARVQAHQSDQSLTLSELRAMLRNMVIRTMRGPARGQPIQPVSLTSPNDLTAILSPDISLS